MRVFGYVRVSKAREDMVSPDIQRDEMSRYAGSKGWDIVRWFEDIDLSASKNQERRVALKDMVNRACDGEAELVLVYRLDRLTRQPAHYYAVREVLREGGVRLDAVQQPYDDSPEGEFRWGLDAVLSQLYALRLGQQLRGMHRTIARMGRWSGGVVPYGWTWVKDREGSRLVAEPTEAEWRRWMHSRFQQGWTIGRISRSLNEQRAPTRLGGLWSPTGVRQMLSSPLQVGARSVDGTLALGGNVEPLLDRSTFEVTQALLSHRPAARGRITSQPVGGKLLRCGYCGGPLYAHYDGPGIPIFRCERRSRGGDCAHGVNVRASVLLPIIESRFIRHMRGRSAPVTEPVHADESLEPLMAELERAREGLTRLALLAARSEIDEHEFRRARDRLRREQERLTKDLDKRLQQAETKAVDDGLLDVFWEDLGRLTPEAWKAVPSEIQRDIYALVIREVIVYGGKGRNRKVRIIWRPRKEKNPG